MVPSLPRPKKLLQVWGQRHDWDKTDTIQEQDPTAIFWLKGKQGIIYLLQVFDKSQNLGIWNLQGLQDKKSENISEKLIYKNGMVSWSKWMS